jgi:PAS domain-containing protein
MMRTTLDSGNPMAVWWGQDEVHLIDEVDDRSWEPVQPAWPGQHARACASDLRKELETSVVSVLFFRIAGDIVAVNDAFVGLSGYRHDEQAGSAPFVDLAGNEFRAATSALLRRLFKTASAAPKEMVRPKGQGGWALGSRMVLNEPLEKDKPTTEAAADVSDTTSDPILNARVEEQFRELTRAVGPTAFSTDAEGTVEDSPSWHEFTGQSVDEWIGWGLVNAARPADHPPVDARCRPMKGAGRGWGLMRARAIPLRHGGTVRSGMGNNVDPETGLTAAALCESLTRLAPTHTADGASTRAQVARDRAAELRRRRDDLAAGFGATEQTVATARLRAKESLRRAQLAHQIASEHAAAIADQFLAPGDALPEGYN